MASGRARCTRKLRTWVVEQVESGQFPGVCWEDAAKTMFRIPWKHAGKQDFREDQDAAFFKAWAIFKGKYKEGDTEGPAIWKTRLRCALNKSPEFEEVPENSHRDGAEPYKVYRLLPPGTLPASPAAQKSPSKRHHSSVSPEREDNKDTVKNCILSPSLFQDPLRNEEVEANGGAGHSDFGSSSSNSPEPQEGTDTNEAPFQGEQVSLELLPPPDSDYSLLLTFIYNGQVVGEAQVQSLDCRLVAEPSDSQCSMEQVVFPKPGPQEPTHRLLSQLEKGVLVASNSRGLFVERLCPIPISWSAPQSPPGPGPHMLPPNKCVELFRTTHFCRDLQRYFQGLGPQPKFQVTLNFLEEDPSPNHTPQNLISVQMEQAFARQLLQETPEDQAAALSLVQSLGDYLPLLHSVLPISFERDSFSTLLTCLSW
ncbi:LOW QUALITY PROTEIN: interferon regulatory factor 9 [Desmodus rotundus]|uniref:LOW QUALITY PROTEIN: interferon regulatory factor 9 n=1 Tax=Desmodus rotundus TaxID=9430 RepID=UPI000D17EA6B|nr:LOW QUALITY PROTEIN: interferon regulatory factor 9 [Desmodus rotundus]